MGQFNSSFVQLHPKGHKEKEQEHVIVKKDKEIKLCDFGWSTQRKKNETMRTICGTYEYMSPELLI